MRRVVSWICFHLSRGRTKAEILDHAAKRRPPIPAVQIEEAFETACLACRNADLIKTADPSMRICDIPGIVLPRKNKG